MTKKQLKYSLVFPVIAVLSGIFWIVTFWAGCGEIFFNEEIIPEIPLIYGGLLSAFLTVKFQIDTSRYFKVRMIFFVISLFTFTVPVLMARVIPYSENLYYFLGLYLIIAPCIAFISEMICFIKIRLIKKPKKFVIVLLSDVLAGIFVMLLIIMFIIMNDIPETVVCC